MGVQAYTAEGKNAIISRNKGEKEHTMVYDEIGGTGRPVENIYRPLYKRTAWVLSDSEVLQLAQ